VYGLQPDGSVLKFITGTRLVVSEGIKAPRNRVGVAGGDVKAGKRSSAAMGFVTSLTGFTTCRTARLFALLSWANQRLVARAGSL
jgi:hypothetical protein